MLIELILFLVREDIKLVGILPSKNSHFFLPMYFKHCSFRLGLFAWGRIPLHLLIPMRVAEQLVATETATRRRNMLSILCQTYCDVQRGFVIPKERILNKSIHDYQMVSLIPYAIPKNFGVDPDIYEYILRQFSVTKFSTLERMLGTLGAGARSLLRDIDVDPKKKGIDLSLDEYVQIAQAYNRWPHKAPVSDMVLELRDI